MDIDINTLRGLATVFCMVAFIGVVLWAYSDRKRKDFDEAANLPFSGAEQDAGLKSGLNKSHMNKNKEAPNV